MRFIFRADASKATGTGHVMRSIGIIEELISRNLSVVFVGNTSQVEWIDSFVNSIGFEEIYSNEKDFKPNKETDVLILDSYQIPVDNELISRINWRFTTAVVDYSTPNYAVDLKIFPSFIEESNYLSNSVILSGPRYIPLRKNINKIHPIDLDSKLNIVVSGGGVDSDNFAVAVSNELATHQSDFNLSIFTNQSDLLTKDSRFTIYKIGSGLDIVANSCNLAFTTASSTSVEFISRGCAVGLGCSTDNQLSYYQQFPLMGIARQVGKLQNGHWFLNKTNIAQLINSRQLRQELSKKCTDLVDFSGAKRIVDKILLFVKNSKY